MSRPFAVLESTLEALRSGAAEIALAQLAPALAIPARPASASSASDEGDASGVLDDTAPPPLADIDMREQLAREGIVCLRGIVPASFADGLARGIAQLVDAGLPAVFAYAFPTLWELGERIREVVSSAASTPYVLVDDAWAFSIAPGEEGWPPHRGLAKRLDRDRPELLNVWVALTEATPERSCLHFVALDDDEDYPERLERAFPPPGRARAAPVAAGDALAWNANVIHWGGPCSHRAPAPRISCTFSLARGCLARELPLIETTMDGRARLDAVARQIATYGRGQAQVSDALLDWAHATTALRARIDDLARRLRDGNENSADEG